MIVIVAFLLICVAMSTPETRAAGREWAKTWQWYPLGAVAAIFVLLTALGYGRG